jgi:hypothetical protein
MMIRTAEHSHVNTQMAQRQPFAGTRYPPMMGPNTGPQTPADDQMQIMYTTTAGSYMSASVPPPVARQGLPQKPVSHLKKKKKAVLGAKPTGSWNRMKARSVQKKMPLRPSFGISERGDHNIGPTP